jgi:hypothetical protein
MVFSDSSGGQGLVEDIDFLLGTSSSDYSLANKARNINSWYDRAVNLILSADGSWEWDDENYTSTRPIATTSLVANQQDYSLAGEGILRVLRVELKDSAGNWTQLEQFSQDDKRGTALVEFLKTAGTPQYFDLAFNSIFLYPKPDYSLSGGLKIYYQRDFDHFTASDTTQYPGFNPLYHRLLSFGAALDYAIANTMPNKIAMCQNEIAKLEAGIIDSYSTRNRDLKTRMSLKKEEYGVSDDDIGEESVDWSST